MGFVLGALLHRLVLAAGTAVIGWLSGVIVRAALDPGSSLQSADSGLALVDRWRGPSPGTTPPAAPAIPGRVRRRWLNAWPPSLVTMSALVCLLVGCLLGAWWGSVDTTSPTVAAAARAPAVIRFAAPDGCRDARPVDGDQYIGPIVVIDGRAVTVCQHFLDRLDSSFKSIFDSVRRHDEQVIRGSNNYKIAYFVAPLSKTRVAVSLPPSPLLQLLGAERVMELYTGDEFLRHGLARTLTGADWDLVLIPVNTGFLGLHGVEAVHLIGPKLHDARTAGVLGLSVSTAQSLATARALGRIPVFTTAVTGEFMRSASNLWLTQMTNGYDARVLVDAALRNRRNRPVTVITDGKDGESVTAIRSGGSCPSAHTPINDRYSTELTRDLVSNIKARHMGVSCLDYRVLEPLTEAGPFRCARLHSGILISVLRGWALGQFMQVLDNCPGRFTIVSGEGATNLTETGQDTLRHVWRRRRLSLIYLGYQSTDPHHQERGEQAEATGADSASALWAAAGAALSLTKNPQRPGPWSAGYIIGALARQPINVPAIQLDGGQAPHDPPLNRPRFTFKAGSRQAASPGGGTRPVALCTVFNVNGSGIIDHCQPPLEHSARRS